MKNLIRSTTEFAMHIIGAYAKPEMTIIDATCGNGHDTLSLARMNPAKLYAFDVQQEAINATREILTKAGYDCDKDTKIHLICASHAKMSEYIDAADIVVFNLGYLPGADKNITTEAESTVSAVAEALKLLNNDGLICITMYDGHKEGVHEKEKLLTFASKLDSAKFHAAYINMYNQPNNPPEILLITKKSRQVSQNGLIPTCRIP